MGRFKARDLRDGTSLEEIRRTLNEIQKELAVDLGTALSRARVTELIIDGPYAARYGDVVRVAPPSAGLRVMLPPKNLEQPGARVVVVVEGVTGALSVEAVDATVNGADTVTYLAGLGTVEFQLTPTGWYGWSVALVDMTALAGAGLSFAAGAFAVNGSTSITIASDQVQRAALTGEATAGANSNAVTVTRATDYNTTPWTGNHKFSGEVRLGTLHSELNKSGALNVTLTAGSTRLLITSSANITLGTISGAADGRVLALEHVRASGAGDLTITHAVTTDAVACPGSVPLVLSNRGCCWLVCRDDVWRVIATTN